MLSPEELKESPLFQNISYESYLAMYDCFQAVNRSFRPYEVMYDYTSGSVSADSDSVGVIERGTASLIRIDENGVATVLEELGPGGVFGKALAFAGSSQDVLEVVCRTACEVVYIRYSQILKRCENACLHHSLLVQNMLRLISEKAQALSQRVDVLSRRSIREKLLCCFQQLTSVRAYQTCKIHLGTCFCKGCSLVKAFSSAGLIQLHRSNRFSRFDNMIQGINIVII